MTPHPPPNSARVPSPTPRAQTRAHSPRAFALPMVIMIVMLASLLIAVMLQRSSAQGYTVKRQMDSYLEHHASRGFQEVLNFWIGSLGRFSLLDVLEEDGHAFDLILTDRSVVSVSIADAQGSLTTSLVGLSDDQEYLVLEPLHWLDTMYPGRTDLVRPAGPIAASAQTAPKEVLDAIEGALLDAEPTGTLASAILAARADGKIDAAELTAAGSEAGFTSGQTAGDFRQLLTVEPTMYRAIVELRVQKYGGGTRLAARYSGLMQIQPSNGTNGNNQQRNNQTLVSSSLFLSWGPLPIE